MTDAELRQTVGVGGRRERAAVGFPGGFHVKQWKPGWAEVNKDCQLSDKLRAHQYPLCGGIH